MHNLIYGGVNSEDYKAYITNAGLYKSPEKRYKKHTIPGRNGDLLEDTGTYENVEVEYPICVYENCDNNLQDFVAAMRRKKGYQRIEDTFHPDYYRMGAFLDEFEPKEVTSDAEMCNGVLKFDCMPQKFLKSGEQPICFFETYVSDDPIGIQTISTILGDNKTLKIRLHIVENDTYVLLKYNDGEAGSAWNTYQFPSPATSGGRKFPAGDYTFNVELPSDAGAWRLVVGLDSAIGLEGFFAEIDADIVAVPGDVRTIHAIFAPELRITNPTGFVSKPIIEYLFLSDSNIRITNIEDGEQQDFYEVSFADVGNIFMDCDQQYAYDYLGNNVSDQMSIITAEHADGRSLVFPEFGADTIKIDMLQEITPLDDSKRNTIIFIYPRWWTV